MHGEVMDGQVRLADATDKPHVFGIGAPDKLQGEILIVDSVAWVAKIRDGNRIEVRKGSPEDSAVLLAITQVPRWTEVTVTQDISADEFDDCIQKTISQAGLDKLETVPFVIEGQFSSLDLHVLNGECPFAKVKGKIEGAGPPHRKTLNDVQGQLVGFYAENGAGRITHHSTHTHVHALVGTEEERGAGHVDAVALKAGTAVRVPMLISERN
jgi:alpha-acetolactate decarboxylase